MKIKFEADLAYQQQAVSSVVDLFKGQEQKQSLFTITGDVLMGQKLTETGIGNRLDLDRAELRKVQDNRRHRKDPDYKKQQTNFEQILNNLQTIQVRNGIAPNTKLTDLDFDVEMETGTGKTYVYLRSVLALHKEYGFSKFIVVVPSIAIKEGVYHSLEITREHFEHIFEKVPYEFFVYNSGDLAKIRSFATNNTLSIMVINIDSFKKDFADDDEENSKSVNIINRKHDKFDGMKPIDVIAETNPIVIIDEPQSVDTTDKSSQAIERLNPLCIFRYSATHVTKHTALYRLDAVDSYELGLVKQIEVAGFEEAKSHNDAYLCLKSVSNKNNAISAKIEMDVQNKSGTVTRKTVTVKQGSDLEELSGGREVYKNYLVDEIYCVKGEEYVSFTQKDEILLINKPVGNMSDDTIKRGQIKKTIEEHLNKELILNEKGIKVLSLFFIDRVANYRVYDSEGRHSLGKYGKWFEEEYTALIRKPKYQKLKHYEVPAENVHKGYFSIDKKRMKDTTGSTKLDENTYDLIMKDKEKLLSLDEDLRFIFSHSALREGWDNPNVFQICTLNETKSEVKKRQEIGRGLRLCVNQNGERQYDRNVNILTVMANESYNSFAEALQKEYAEDQGIRFGYVEEQTFANIEYKNKDGQTVLLGMEKSKAVCKYFKENGYIDSDGKIQDTMRSAVKSGQLDLPECIEKEAVSAVTAYNKKLCGKVEIKNYDDKKTITLNKAVFCSLEFEELWNKIKWKTVYNIQFDSKELIKNCNKALENFSLKAPQLFYKKAQLDIDSSGVTAKESKNVLVENLEMSFRLPDILSWLQNKTGLTRQTLIEILVGSDSLKYFPKNPQIYMEEVLKIVLKEMRKCIKDGIKYEKLGDNAFYSQELFKSEELVAYFTEEKERTKSVYSHIVFDSEVEKSFAERLESDCNVKLYVKLPDWFKIHTPLGNYIPDWAILYEKDDEQRLYFVVETKSTLDEEKRRDDENYRIACGKAHFDALKSASDDALQYDVADSYETFKHFVEG